METENDKEIEKNTYSTFLSDEEKEKIKKQALKELDDENKKKVAEDYKASVKAEAKRKILLKDAKPGETVDGLVSVFIDLPKVAECIRLDGTAYYPMRTYNVLPSVRDVILDIMSKGRNHEDEVSGRKDSNQYRTKNPLNVR